MKPFRPGQTYKAPYFTPSQIDNMCCDELRGVGLLPVHLNPSASTASSKNVSMSPHNTRTCQPAYWDSPGWKKRRQGRCHFGGARCRRREGCRATCQDDHCP